MKNKNKVSLVEYLFKYDTTYTGSKTYKERNKMMNSDIESSKNEIAMESQSNKNVLPDDENTKD